MEEHAFDLYSPSPILKVTFQDGATTLGSATLSGGSATLAIATLSGGAHSITAVYSGDGNFVTSISPVFVQTISPAASTTTLTSAPNPSQYNQTVVLSAKVSAATEADINPSPPPRAARPGGLP